MHTRTGITIQTEVSKDWLDDSYVCVWSVLTTDESGERSLVERHEERLGPLWAAEQVEAAVYRRSEALREIWKAF